MTEQTKIPLPNGNGPKDGGSLIERAVESFGWGQFAAPPVPASFKSQIASKPAVPEPAAEVRAVAVEPAQPEIRPEVVEAEPEAIVEAAPAAVMPAPVVRPVVAPAASSPRDDTEHPIDREHLRRQGFIQPEGNVSATLEEFRIVKRQLLLNAADLKRQGAAAKGQRLLICSPHPGEGKTYCAVNLALAIAAERESEVLLVDADFAKPSVLSALGLPGGQGLMDALADPALDVADLVLNTDIPGLKVLPAGNATNRDSENLNSSRTASVLDRLTEDAPHRIVIFDSPPALAASPAAELAKYAGQALVICRAGQTGQQSLEDAISLLSGCPNIQLLLNAASFSPSGRKFGAYYGYGA
ncbi:capsular biosynthesis protein [Novosphingobium sp. PS1R-30]|uniref:Capsular biosynthesis protein n=1 Tax=Novosphingobium anseongense TaxID=3133436 RepID=A0ABU8RRD9_9SPHN